MKKGKKPLCFYRYKTVPLGLNRRQELGVLNARKNRRQRLLLLTGKNSRRETVLNSSAEGNSQNDQVEIEGFGGFVFDERAPSVEDLRESAPDNHVLQEVQLSQNELKMTQALYPGSKKSIACYLYERLLMVRRHKMSRCAMVHLFKTDRELIPRSPSWEIPKSWYLIQRSLSGFMPRFRTHYFCPTHLTNLDEAENGLLKCPTDHETFHPSCDELKKSYFTTVSLADTLRAFLRMNWKHILLPKDRKHIDGNVIEDLLDGTLYTSLRTRLNLAPTDLTISVHYDGVQPYKGKSASQRKCYIAQFTVNELKPASRQRNVFFCLCYCGFNPPPVETLFAPIVDELNVLMNVGIDLDLEGIPTVKVFPILFPCDTVERNKICCVKKHNGYYSCVICEQPGSWDGTHIFEYSEEDADLREHNDILEKSVQAACYSERGRKRMATHFKGIKGLSVSTSLNPLPVILYRSFPADFLHLICEGIFRQILDIWISHNIIDTERTNWFLSLLDPTVMAKRLPRSLLERNHYSATEFLMLLMFYGPVIFRLTVRRAMYKHYLRLVRITHLILFDQIQRVTLPVIQMEVKAFIREFQGIYGKFNMFSNLHQLLHTAQHISDWGQVCHYWTFHLEGNLGKIGRRVHGSQATAKEIAQTAALEIAERALSLLVQHSANDSWVQQTLLNPQKRKTAVVVRSSQSSAVLNGVIYDETEFPKKKPEVASLVRDVLPAGFKIVNASNSCVLDAGFTCKADGFLRKKSRRNSSFIWTSSGKVVQVKACVAAEQAGQVRMFLVGKNFEIGESSLFKLEREFPHFFSLTETDNFSAVPSTEVLNAVMFIDVVNESPPTGILVPNCLNCDL